MLRRRLWLTSALSVAAGLLTALLVTVGRPTKIKSVTTTVIRTQTATVTVTNQDGGGSGSGGGIEPTSGTTSLYTYLHDLLDTPNTNLTSDNVYFQSDEQGGDIAGHRYDDGVVLEIENAASDPAEASIELPLPDHTTALTADVGMAKGTPTESSLRLRVYANRATTPPIAAFSFQAPDVRHHLQLDELGGTSTLILRWIPSIGQDRLPNGTKFVLGAATIR